MRGTLAELAEWAADGVLGEITVVLAGAEPHADLDDAGGRGDRARRRRRCGSRTRAPQVIAANPGCAVAA